MDAIWLLGGREKGRKLSCSGWHFGSGIKDPPIPCPSLTTPHPPAHRGSISYESPACPSMAVVVHKPGEACLIPPYAPEATQPGP